jgi:WD40 repeat protein
VPEPDLLHELSEELRLAFVWAQAMELDAEVGTRTVVIAMIRVGRGESDVEELLRTFEIPPDVLYDAFQDVAPQWRIDPSVSMPLSGTVRPVLTPNVERAVRLARASRSPRRWSSGPVQQSELFGAILRMPDSTAYRGLELALGGRVSLDRVADAHVRYLEGPDGRSFGEVLRRQLRGGESPVPDPGEMRPPDSRPPVCALALSSDRNAYAIAYAGGGVALWDDDWPSGRPVHASSTEATALAFSPSGDRLAIALEGGSVLIWAARSGEVELQFGAGGERRLWGVAWSPDGDRLVSAGADGTLHEWQLGTPASGRVRTVAAVSLRAVAWPAGADPVALGDDGRLYRRDRSLEELSVFPAGSGASMFALSADGRHVAVADTWSPITVFDVQSGTATTVVRELRDSLLSLALSPDGTRVAYVGAGGAVSVDDVSLPVRVGDHVEWLSDRYAEVDRLGRKGLAEAIATRLDRVSRATPDESFLIHLDGPWGAGKSTILHFLRERLEDRWLIVDFDAWRQARVGPPWWALLTSLRRALRRRLGWRRGAWLRVRETAARIRRDHAIAATAVLVITAVLAYLLAAPDAVSLPAWVALIAWAVGAVTLLLGPGRGLAAFLMWDSAMGAKRYEQWHRDPMEGLAEHFAWLVTHSPWPILFFVDDLDRCDEGHVVDLLDSIQTLVRDSASGSSGAPCFAVAADGRWIRRSYERTHEGFDEAIGEPGRPLGYLFLDKLFQLTVEVPTIGRAQQEGYLRHLLGVERVDEPSDGMTVQNRIAGSRDEQGIVDALNSASPRDRVDATAAAIKRLSEPSVERATEHDLQKFAGVLERNPRSMKRFVNAYSMALITALIEGRRVDRERLALWTVLRLRWPDLAEHLRERPERLDGLHASPAAPDLPGRLAELGASPELSRVLDFDGSRLSSDAIRALTGT